MADPKIKGGFILLARKMLTSGIMEKPPLWSKLFIWMLLKANKTDGYNGLKAGEFYTNIREMQEAMTHYVGYRKEAPTPKQIRVIYEGLSEGTAGGTVNGTGEMIKAEPLKGNRGLKITVLNYEHYQNPENYEGHKKSTPQKPNEGHSEKFTKDDCRAQLISVNKNNHNKHKKYIYPDMIDFVIGFVFYIQEQKPKFAPSLTKTHLEDSYKTIIDLVRLDGFEWEYIKTVIRWAKTDADFWADNLQSLATLRKKSKANGLKKFQNIAKSYEHQKAKGGTNGRNQTPGNYTKPDTRQSAIPPKRPDYKAAV